MYSVLGTQSASTSTDSCRYTVRHDGRRGAWNFSWACIIIISRRPVASHRPARGIMFPPQATHRQHSSRDGVWWLVRPGPMCGYMPFACPGSSKGASRERAATEQANKPPSWTVQRLQTLQHPHGLAHPFALSAGCRARSRSHWPAGCHRAADWIVESPSIVLVASQYRDLDPLELGIWGEPRSRAPNLPCRQIAILRELRELRELPAVLHCPTLSHAR